ncbi:hypothetical protein IWZ01DRAFT_492082 [Phyllosticta capitalensis]
MATEVGKAYKKESPIAGNGLFAKQDIPEGELIFSIQRPLFTELDSTNLQAYCSNCFVRSENGMYGAPELRVRACTGCRVVCYCSKRCQSIAWKRQHKPQCSIWKGLNQGGSLPHAVRLVAQVLVSRKNGKVSDDDWEAFESLPSHVDKLRQRSDYTTHAVMIMGAWKYSGVEIFWDFQMVEEIYARVLANSLTITTSILLPIGVGVDPFASCANHSCVPNAFVVFDGTKLSYRALKPITKDEEIFMSYIDDTYPFLHRQKELRETYYFDCKCSKCEKGCDTIEDRLQKPSPEQGRKIARFAHALPRGGPQPPPSNSPLSAEEEDMIYTLAHKLPKPVAKPRNSPSPLSADLYALEAFALDHIENEGGPKPTRILPNMSTNLTPVVVALWLLSATGVWPVHRQPFPDLIADYLYRTSASSPGALREPGYNCLGPVWMFSVLRYILIDPILYPAHHPLRTTHTFALANHSLVLMENGEAKQRAMVELGIGAALKKRINFEWVAMDLLLETKASVEKSHGPDSQFAKMITQDAIMARGGRRPGYDPSKREERRRLLEEVARKVDKQKFTWFTDMMHGRFMEKLMWTFPTDELGNSGTNEAAVMAMIR